MKVKRVGNKKKAKEIEKRMAQKKAKIQYVLDACPPIETLETSSDPDKIPLGQLISACRQFMMECYENAILNSAFAVEYALLFKINSELDDMKREELTKEYRGGFDLRYALNTARGKWIDEKLYNELQLLNNLRDMSAHPSNWITLYNLLNKQFEDEAESEKWVSRTIHKSPDQIAELFKEGFDVKKAHRTFSAMNRFADRRWANLPDLEWASKKDTLEFQKDYVKRYSKPMIKEMIEDKEIIELIKKPSSAAKHIISKYNFPEDTALKAIDMALKTFKQLKIV